MQRPRFPFRRVLAHSLARLRGSIDAGPSPEPETAALITQDSLEQSTAVAQTLLDSGGLRAGQRITIEGHRAMAVTVEAGRVVLIPAEEAEAREAEAAERAAAAKAAAEAEAAGRDVAVDSGTDSETDSAAADRAERTDAAPADTARADPEPATAGRG